MTNTIIENGISEYSPTVAALADLRDRYSGVVYDLATVKGNEAARAARKELVTLRTTLEAKRKSLKEPALERCRLIDAEAKRITGEILALEDPIDAQIRSDEKRREVERAEKARIEAERQAAIAKKIDWIVGQPVAAAGKSSARIAEMIATLTNAKVDLGVFAEQTGRATVAKTETLARLEGMRAAAAEQEAEAARLKAERDDLERQRREQAERDRQQRELIAAEERAAKAAREAEEARLRAERQAEEARIRAQREALEAEQRRVREEQQAEAKRLTEAAAEIERKRAALAPQPPAADEQLPSDEEMAADNAGYEAELSHDDDASNDRTTEVRQPTIQRPSDDDLAEAVAEHFNTTFNVAYGWLSTFGCQS